MHTPLSSLPKKDSSVVGDKQMPHTHLECRIRTQSTYTQPENTHTQWQAAIEKTHAFHSYHPPLGQLFLE